MEGSSIRPTTAGLWKCDLPALSEVEWASSRRFSQIELRVLWNSGKTSEIRDS